MLETDRKTSLQGLLYTDFEATTKGKNGCGPVALGTGALLLVRPTPQELGMWPRVPHCRTGALLLASRRVRNQLTLAPHAEVKTQPRRSAAKLDLRRAPPPATLRYEAMLSGGHGGACRL